MKGKINKEKSIHAEGKYKPNWTDIISSICNIVMVIISIGGLFLVLQELKNVQEQNSYLNRSLIQSYRPLGIFKSKDTLGNDIILKFIETESKEKISFSIERDFYNKGEGILFLTGYMWYLTDKQINFRKSFLNNEISDVKPDGFYPYTRNYPYKPNEKTSISAIYIDVEMKKAFFLYTLAFYKDQDQNLYDTQHLEVFYVNDPLNNGKGFLGRFDKSKSGAYHENYHLYKPEERKKLIEQAKKLNLHIGEYLSDEGEGN